MNKGVYEYKKEWSCLPPCPPEQWKSVSPCPPLYAINPLNNTLLEKIEDKKISQKTLITQIVQQSVQQCSTKYLQKRGRIYYFSKRINGKHIKVSLKSSNLEYCKMLRDRIIRKLEMKEVEQADIIKNDWGEEEFCYEVPLKIDAGIIRIDRILKSDYEVLKLIDNNEERKKLLNKLSNETRLLIKSIEIKNKNRPIQVQAATPQIQPTEEKVNIYFKLDNYYKDYIEHRKSFSNVSQSTIKANNASFRYLKYFLEENSQLNFKFFKELQKQFQELPKNFFKYPKYYEKTYLELLVFKEKENYDTLDTKTINAHINNFRLFFDYLRYEEIIDKNPLTEIKPLLETKGTNKEEYTTDELKKIFESDMDLSYKNMCKVALYCGLRIEEVLSLKKENIKDNLLYVDLEDKSTKKHQRIVPIHQNLLETLNYQIKKNRSEFIFFDGNIGNEVKNVGKRINRRLKNIIDIKEKSFHSFRKNFSQNIELNSNSEDKIKKYLMGHSQSKDITHMIYNRGKVNIDKLVECISSLDFAF